MIFLLELPPQALFLVRDLSPASFGSHWGALLNAPVRTCSAVNIDLSPLPITYYPLPITHVRGVAQKSLHPWRVAHRFLGR